MNWAKVPAYLALGAVTRPLLFASLTLMPVAASTLVSVWLVRRMVTTSFYRLVYALKGAELIRSAVA